ncbi:MAG: RDD family protein [Planctomycetota bacterium]
MRYWLSNNDGKTTGPYGLEEIRAFAGSGRLSPAAMACAEGSTEWQPISSVLTAPPTAPVTAGAVMDGACGCCGMMPPKKPKTLYGHTVCKKCYTKFANRRQLAYIVDVLCLWVAVFAVGMALGEAGALAGMPEDTIELLGTLLGWALCLVFLLKDGFRGTSPGKWLCGVQVLDARTGAPIGAGASFKRNLPLLIPIVGQLIILIQMLKGPRLGDGWAHTKVIWKKYAEQPIFRPSGALA